MEVDGYDMDGGVEMTMIYEHIWLLRHSRNWIKELGP